MKPADEYKNRSDERADPQTPGRLIDEILAYIRARQKGETTDTTTSPDLGDERFLRRALRHCRRRPLPTILLGVSLTWLLLADDQHEDGLESEPGDGRERWIEDEIIGLLKGGYEHTGQRLRQLVDQYPIPAAAAVLGGGLLAAFLLPDRHRSRQENYIEPEPVEDETAPGEDFGFDPLEEDDNP